MTAVDERSARMALCALQPMGNPELAELVARSGPAEVWAAVRRMGEESPWGRKSQRVDPAELISATSACGARQVRLSAMLSSPLMVTLPSRARGALPAVASAPAPSSRAQPAASASSSIAAAAMPAPRHQVPRVADSDALTPARLPFAAAIRLP